MKHVNRKINYFQLTPVYSEGKSTDDFVGVVDTIVDLTAKKDPQRFQRTTDKFLYLSGLNIKEDQKLIYGKIHAIRMDAFPELFNTESDEFKDFVADSKDGIVETSHFIISFKKELLLSFEFNQFGPRVTDLAVFLTKIGEISKIFSQIAHVPFSRDELSTYKRRIGKISQIVAKVHKDNIKRVNEYSTGMFEAMEATKNASDAEIIILTMKFDYRKLPQTEKANTMIGRFIDLINSKKPNPFDSLQVRAEDSQNNYAIRDFDILNIWLKSIIKVEQKEKSRSLVSSDIFDKMRKEFEKEFRL